MTFSQWEYKLCVAHVENSFKGLFRGSSTMVKLFVDDIEMNIVDALKN